MALEYTLDIEGCAPIELAQELLAGTHWKQSKDGSFKGPGLKVGVSAPSEMHGETISETYGFQSAVRVDFRLDKFAETDGGWRLGEETMLVLAIKALEHFDGDAVLLFNGENPVFYRFAKRLIWNKEWPNLLKLSMARDLVASYELGPIPAV